MSFGPKDPTLPLILPDTAFARRVYTPSEHLLDYINHLLSKGYSADSLPEDLADFYALDFYVAQVNNGGHSQFIHNSHDHLFPNMERAERGARRIDLPELAEVIARCAEWCRAHPGEASRQDGFGTRAADLDSLDKLLFALNFDDEALATYLDMLEPPLAAQLREHLFAPEGAAELVALYVEEAMTHRQSLMPEAAAAKAAYLLAPLIEGTVSKDYGTTPSPERDKALERQRQRLWFYMDQNMADTPEAELRAELSKRAMRDLVSSGLYERGRYQIAAHVWIAQHSNLQLVTRHGLKDAWDEVVANSPFALSEQEARALDALHAAVPSDEKMALAAALGQLRRPCGTGPLPLEVTRSFRANSTDHQRHVLVTTDGNLFLEMQDGMVTLSDLTQSLRHQIAWRAYGIGAWLGVVTAAQQLTLLQTVPKDAPGRKRASSRIDPALRQLMFDLHLPEALALFTDDKERHIYFARGALDRFDPQARAVSWRFRMRDEDVVFEADETGIIVRTNTGEARYSTQILKTYRNERTRA